MTRFGKKFALAAAVLSFRDLVVVAQPTTSAPTKKPTSAPTNPPTKKPTNAPTTLAPTKKPTNPPTAYLGSGEWYADTANGNLCSKDCAVSTLTPDCSGINHDTATWLTDTYADAATCCEQKFSYLDVDYCASRSKGTPTSTGKFYADTASSSCKVDDSATKGPFQSGTLFDTAAACCTGALGWVNSLYCTSRSTGGTGYHSKWYVDYQDMVCKQDCAISSSSPACKPTTDASASNTLFDTAAACCAGKLGWIPAATCASVSTTGVATAVNGTAKFYADYSSSPARCAKDCNTANDPTCGGILTNVAGVQMFDTAAACCAAKFSWMDKDYCAALTTGASTNKWYVDYQSNTCKKDCPAATNSPCGGSPPDLSMQLFADAATCCSTKLGWVQASTCTGASTSATTAASGSLKYYADYTSGTCKKDCAVATTAPECGGVLANSVGVQLFDSAATCCAGKFGWIDKDLCTAMGTGGYTNKFYVDYADNACKQDCAAASGTNCAGHPGDKATQLFSTAAACCSSKLSYLNQATCVSKSTTGSAASATGSAKWYADWSVSARQGLPVWRH
ncbi:hypothetical protein HJC23_011773 [Cyclotella cryptica]|uniref:Uncharacterized protein n=1 Tax=Cyclotella cryptica TaxID=29204 RepID=A0ABD3PHQ1_9STRA|eukprot:CCRYP_014305-RA/>CCRYP_014305-RA protein AED:0.18 eAED:0.18 QI:0/-1/0/1/-1/1/1/0/564